MSDSTNLFDATDESFRDLYKNNDLLILDFWAVWCGPCQNFKPVFESVSESFKDVVFAKINVDLCPELSKYFSIVSVPTLLIIRDQIEVFRGASRSEQSLKDLVKEVALADMDEVKAKLGVE